MNLYVGLGNPGEKYLKNRHNVGFVFIDRIVDEIIASGTAKFKANKKLESEIAEVSVSGSKWIFAKPQTYMNLSGKAVGRILSYYKISSQRLTVAHDDLDIMLGSYKIQQGSGPKMHNGITSVEDALRTKDFRRVRIGIENRTQENRVTGEEYVLSNFTSQEYSVLSLKVFPKIETDLGLTGLA